jgi:hypothetical protein
VHAASMPVETRTALRKRRLSGTGFSDYIQDVQLMAGL